MLKKRLIRILIIASISFYVFTAVIMPYRLGPGSEIGIGGITFVDRVTYRFRAPKTGDQVVAKILSENVAFVAEIIAVPGDIVHTKSGLLFVNDLKMPKSPLQVLYTKPKTLNANQYLVRMISEPYTVMGVIKHKNIIGKLF